MAWDQTSHRFFILLLFICSALAQNKVNILILYDDGDTISLEGINSAVKYMSQNPGQGTQVNKKYIKPMKKGDNIGAIVNATCDIVDAAIDAGDPPHVVLDATKTGLMSEIAKSFTRSLSLPTFAASYGHAGDIREWSGLSENERNYLVQVMPPGDIMVQVIRDIVKTQNFTNAAILYDESFVMDHKYKSLLRNLPCRHIIVITKKSDSDIRMQLKELKDADMVNFFAVGSLKNIRLILDAATANMMFGRKYSWYTLTKDREEVECECENSIIFSLMPNANSEVKNRMNVLKGTFGLTAKPEVDAAFYYDFAFRAIKAAGNMAQKGEYDNFQFLKCSDFDEANAPSRDGFDFRSSLKQVSMTETWAPITWGDNGMTYPKVELNMDKITTRRNSLMGGVTSQKNSLGMWDAGMPGELMFESGQNLQDHQAVKIYRVTTVQQPPFIMSAGGGQFDGYCIDLLNEIRRLVNFEFEIYEAPDGKFGTMDENMEWDGMIKELIDKRADIALAPLSVTAERENVVDFTVPYYDLVGITILMKKPKVPTSLFKFLTVLDAEVWVCILAAYIFTSFLLWIFDRFSPYSYQNNKEKYKDDDEQREFSLKECLWFCMTSLTPQGGGEAPKNLSGRLVAATWWLFGFIIIASYTANLAAFLTVSRLDTPIESLTDLSNQYKVQYAPMNGTSTMTYFERMAYIEMKFYEIWKDMSLNDSMSEVERAKLAVWDYPVSDKYTKMWQSMLEAGLPSTFDEALERVRSSKSSSEGFAYLGDATDIRYQVLTNCDLQIIGEEFSRKPYAIAVQRGSPLKDQFNDAIMTLMNHRLLETLKERWWNPNSFKKECEEEDGQSGGISIENIGGVFIVIFVGIALACITLIFEFWWYTDGRATRTTDSGQVVSVREFTPENGKKELPQKSNFKTEYNNDGYDINPVPNPW